MTTQGKIRLTNNGYLSKIDTGDYESMVPAPGSTAGTIYTDFDPKAVERLRTAASQPAKPYNGPVKSKLGTPPPKPPTPTTSTPTPPPKKSRPDPKPPRYKSRPKKPAKKLPPPPPVTMADYTDPSQRRGKTKFIRQHFAGWLAYGREHGLNRQELAELIDMPYPTLVSNWNKFNEHPEVYENAEAYTPRPTPPKPAVSANTATSADVVEGIATNGDVGERTTKNDDTAPVSPPAQLDAQLFTFTCPVQARIAVWNRWHPRHSRVAVITAVGVEGGYTTTAATMTTAHTAEVEVMFDDFKLGKVPVDLTHIVPLGLYTNNSPITGRQYAACPHCRNWQVISINAACNCEMCGQSIKETNDHGRK